MKNVLTLLSVILSLVMTSCVQIDKRGYSFELSEYRSIKERIDDKNNVLEVMGYPILTEYFGKEEFWIYYSEDVERLLFFKPKILSRKIVSISFDEDNNVKEIKNYSLHDQNSIKFDREYTKIKDPESFQKRSWWQRIFSNVGQVRAN